VMKIELETPSGLRITFEGDEDDFELFTGFLTELPGLAETLGSRPAELPPAEKKPPTPDEPPNGGDSFGAHQVATRFEAVEAKTDIDRVTVIAQLAVESGADGVDYDTADRIFEELGYPKPNRWAKTFHNAKVRGFLRSAGERGTWRPTVQGENFARLGRKDAPTRRRTPSRRPNQNALGPGGDSD
jgi:hypothetical protein